MVRKGVCGASEREHAVQSGRKDEKGTHGFGQTHEDEQRVEVVRVRDEVDDGEREREDDLHTYRLRLSAVRP